MKKKSLFIIAFAVLASCGSAYSQALLTWNDFNRNEQSVISSCQVTMEGVAAKAYGIVSRSLQTPGACYKSSFNHGRFTVYFESNESATSMSLDVKVYEGAKLIFGSHTSVTSSDMNPTTRYYFDEGGKLGHFDFREDPVKFKPMGQDEVKLSREALERMAYINENFSDIQ